ncbi:hypothetical protein Taro_038639 [Colocasia esculenta]|uniref:Peptidase C1A papain C-terminal domain-containing protein n=1 Tax=Colocasia esculenta TaxID=4460 RepID=A0A843W413_COLES|nr:hypothetical protein [Colocasia esculenta]
MGIDTDANCPYTARQGKCKAVKVVTIDGHANAPRNNERALGMQVARQPVGSAVDANTTDFQLYTGVRQIIYYNKLYSCYLHILELQVFLQEKEDFVYTYHWK